MHTVIRPLVLFIALAGGLFFSALLTASLARPAWVEQTARTMIRAQIEKKTGEQIAALDARFLDGKARALLREGEREIAAARRALTDGLPARIAAIAAEMGIPDCECRKRHAERAQLRLGSLQQMQAHAALAGQPQRLPIRPVALAWDFCRTQLPVVLEHGRKQHRLVHHATRPRTARP